MDELKQYRDQIDIIDRQLADLFQQRMDVVDKVGQYKLERSLPVLDAKREQEVLAAYLDGKSYQEIAENLGRHVKSIDNALQRVKRKLEKFLEENH